VKVAVVGGGVAGTAAVWQAVRRGAEVVLFHDRPGASALQSGALDGEGGEGGEGRGGQRLDADVLAFVTAFDAWSIGPSPVTIVTDAGVVRSARGADAALLDLTPLAGRRIAVADAPLAGWDADALARAATASRWARDTMTTFDAVPVEAPASAALLPPFDVAASFNDEAALEQLADRLRAAGGGHEAWLLGPWLGTAAHVAEAVRRRVGKPCGETTSPPGGPVGARFEASRVQLLSSLGVTERRTRAVEVVGEQGQWSLRLAEGVLEGPFSAVVLALGGVAAGGILLEDPAAGARGRFRLSIDAPAHLALDGRLIDAYSTLHGVDFSASGLGGLERVGVLADDVRVVGAPGLFAAGDVLAARPRTVLEAVRTGLRAAIAAVS
jgi:glycerol-3-phosphate dehydrogenase subunit B